MSHQVDPPQDPLSRVDQICGGRYATEALRAGIAEFANEQTRHFMGMNDPAWVNKALVAPEWARSELQMGHEAKHAGIQRMQEFLAPWSAL